MAPLNQEGKRDGPEAAPPSAPGGRRNLFTHLSMDEVSAPDDDDTDVSRDDGAAPPPAPASRSFLLHLVRSSGPPQIIALCLLLALSFGSTIGVVPAVVEDRYARLRHGYEGAAACLELAREERPTECARGNEDAQNAAAVESFVSNALTFATSSLIGSISDERGRRGQSLALVETTVGFGAGVCATPRLSGVYGTWPVQTHHEKNGKRDEGPRQPFIHFVNPVPAPCQLFFRWGQALSRPSARRFLLG